MQSHEFCIRAVKSAEVGQQKLQGDVRTVPVGSRLLRDTQRPCRLLHAPRMLSKAGLEGLGDEGKGRLAFGAYSSFTSGTRYSAACHRLHCCGFGAAGGSRAAALLETEALPGVHTSEGSAIGTKAAVARSGSSLLLPASRAKLPQTLTWKCSSWLERVEEWVCSSPVLLLVATRATPKSHCVAIGAIAH